jgi:hypothetical protein
MVIDGSGRVGIGTTSPSVKLEVSGATSSNPEIRVVDGTVNTQWYASNNGECIFGTFSNHPQVFRTSGAERVRIDTSGRLLVGTSTARTSALHTASIQLEGTSFSTATASIISGANDSTGAYLHLGKARGGSIGSTTVVQDGDTLGQIHFTGSDGTNLINGAWISGVVDGTPGANDLPSRLVFSTTADGASSPTERMRIDSSGRVGIGTTTPRQALTFGGLVSTSTATPDCIDLGATYTSTSASTNLKLKLYIDSSGNTYGFTTNGNSELEYYAGTVSSPGKHVFLTGGSERARIDSSGRLLVGTSTGPASSTLVLQGNSDNASFNSVLRMLRNVTDPAANTVLGTVAFGTSGKDSAFIEAYSDGQWGANDYPGRLVFSTTADGASSPTERMRITNGGDFYFNATVTTKTVEGFRIENGGQPNVTRGTDGTLMQFFGAATGTVIGSIVNSGGTATSYNTSSDYRLKENIVPLTGAADRLNQLQVHRFNFIGSPNKTVDGFIAHEAQAVVPECVTGAKDEVDNDGNPVYQGIDQSKLVPLLTAALQEALAKIETLEARLDAANL